MNKSIEIRKERRDAQVAEAPTLLRDAYDIIETRAFPDMHQQEMLQLFVTTNETARKNIGERFSISGCILAEELSYACSVVQNAVFQAAAKHTYSAREVPNRPGKFTYTSTPQGHGVFEDAINTPTAMNFIVNLIRHVKKDPSCADLSFYEISVQAADSITPLLRAISNMEADQVQKFMEFASTSYGWNPGMKEYDYDPRFFSIKREGTNIRIRPTEKFKEYLKRSREMRPIHWEKEGTAFCPMFATKGADDAYRLLLQSLQLALKKTEDAKAAYAASLKS